MELYITTNGTNISKEKESFSIVNNDEKHLLSSEKIEAIILEAECRISSGSIRLAVEKNIPIIISDKYGNIVGQFFGIKDVKSGKIRKAQYNIFSKSLGIEIGKNLIIDKIISQRNHLEELLKRRRIDLKPVEIFNIYLEKIKEISIEEKDVKNRLMGIEGVVSRLYYNEISKLLAEKWKFKTREHINAKEPYNIVLNYLYGILYRKLETIIIKEGLDPTIGIIHSEGNKKLPFLYDFIEKYRFLAFELAFDLFNKKIIKESFFENEKLTVEGKKIISNHFREILTETQRYKSKNFKREDIIRLELKNIKKIILEGAYELSSFI